MEPNHDTLKSRVAATPPPARPANMRTTVEEILLRRRRGEPAAIQPQARRSFPPPRYPYGILSRAASHPALAALCAYGVWMVGWAYYFWSVSAES